MTSSPEPEKPDQRNFEPALKPAHGVSISAPGSQDYAALDPSIRHTVLGITSPDGARTRGILFEPEGRRPKTVVIWSHPSADLLQWWLAPYWVDAGYAAFSFATRYMNNFTDCIHERCLLDVAGAVRYLRDEAGFERVVMYGKSGGASLFAYYQAEANTPVGSRVSAPPGGGSPDLNQFDLVPADGVMFTAGHPGQGKFLERVIDPSVVDENDPLATEPELDMYNPRNGFRRPPEVTRYDRDWLARYREAQLARVARIDAIARTAIDGAANARQATAVAGFADLPESYRQLTERRAEIAKIMVVHRTEANPAYVDLTIDPSDRHYGSIQSTQLDLHNYGLSGFARVVTANAWLSTWSGISSNANLIRNLPKVTQPSYFVFPTGDEDIYPSQFEDQANASGADDKEVDWLTGFNHNLLLPGDGSPDNARRQVMDLLLGWTQKRFPGELTHVLEGAGERSLIVEDHAVATVVLAWPWDANDELLAPLRATYPDIEFVAMPFYGRYTFLELGSEDVLDEDALAVWARADAVMAFDVPKDLASLAPRLRWIQAIGAGVNHLFESDLPEDVVITSASGMGATAIAEFVIGRLLSAWKRFPQLDAHQRDRQWEPEFGRLVDGLNLGIIGLGAIGRSIAVRARPFGLHVIGTRRTFRSGDTDPDVDELFGSGDLMAVLPRCDAVVSCLPGTPDTENVFDATAFATMPQGSIFCNVGRGSSVDEAALIGALESGHLGAAILDVTRAEPLPSDDPLWRAPNLLLSPHCSVSQDRYAERLVGLLGDNLGRRLRGDELMNCVDTGTRY